MAFNRKNNENSEEFVEAPFVIDTEYENEVPAVEKNSEFQKDDVGFVIDDGGYDNNLDSSATESKEKQDTEVKEEAKEEGAENTAEEQIAFSDFSDRDDEETRDKRVKAKGFFTKKRIILLSVILAVLVALLSVFFVLSHYWISGEMKMPGIIAATGLYQGDNFKYFDCVTVNGVEIGGLTRSEAAEKIEDQMKKAAVDYDITVKYEDKTLKLKKDDFDYSVINDTALEEAKQYCIDIMTGKKEKKNKDYTASVSLSEKCKKNLLEKAHKAIHSDPVDATMTTENSAGIVFADEKKGYDVDDKDLLSQIEKTIAAGKAKATITPKVVFIDAKITKKQLTENIELLSTFSTTSRNTANGTANMTKAMNMCNGTVIEPGATWSFNATTGDSENTAAGWLPAAAFSGGYVIQSIGGGICQASTTIYVAALYANMEVVERSAHAWQSSYAAAGFDATVDYRSLDLKLKNTSKFPIYLSCGVSGRELTCKIYGSKKDNFDKIDVFTETIARVPNDYFSVRTYRTVTKNGKSTTTALNTSKYSLKPQMTEAQAAEQKRQEEEAKRKAEEEARRKAEEEARRKAEEEARRKAEEERQQQEQQQQQQQDPQTGGEGGNGESGNNSGNTGNETP